MVSALLVFGDSLCDTGNARALLGDGAFLCPPHWADRRCNGPLWVEGLVAGLHLPVLVPSLQGGTNHAFGGARSGAGLSPKGAPNLLTQVEHALGDGASVPLPPEGALVVLRAGANDYLDAPPGPAIGDGVNRHLLVAVTALVDQGVRRFLVPNELPWGFSPIELPGFGEPQREALNHLIARQNASLREALADLAARRGVVVAQPDFHGLLLQVWAEPAAFGFTEIQRPALPDGPTPIQEAELPDGRGFLWWDGWGHLTSAFHCLLATRAIEAWQEVSQESSSPPPAPPGASAAGSARRSPG